MGRASAVRRPHDVPGRWPTPPLARRNVQTIDDVKRRWVDTMPEVYDRELSAAVFRPFAVDLAARAAALSPSRVLELAAGTGVLTIELARRLPGTEVIATDLNPAMGALGRRRAPGVTWREANAMRLPFEDGQFDLVACQFGVMFFPDKQAAFAEARRVLLPGGSFLFNAWDALEYHEFEAALVAGLRRAFPDDPPSFMESVPHSYPDLNVIAADLAAGRLRREALESVTLVGRAKSAASLAAGYCAGTPLRGEIEARGDLITATAIVAEEMERRLGAGAVIGKMRAHVIHATRQ